MDECIRFKWGGGTKCDNKDSHFCKFNVTDVLNITYKMQSHSLFLTVVIVVAEGRVVLMV